MKGPPFMQPWLGKEKQKTARRKNIPTKIIQKFTSLFPSTKDENWTYHRETYFVTFYHHNRFCRVELTKKGELAHVFHKTSRNAIPKDLAKKMLSNRLGYHLLHVWL
ncbi:MAG: hypothetical protein OEY56_09795, partial [Cyclobacteriaceae bacterium]|nr:hypothetical protein [Cyclobacteriaceae bacterium]